ncbi:MAG TPA: isoprenylcysteine carboxylmethyltransferase family protein [Anaerolineales bacterium]|nr:isoprenylcysteine carboxylmethyltransferase family protein [Anaerolineales bacterium]
MATDDTSARDLSQRTLRLWVVSALVMGAVFFLPAGTLAYWQAWVYMGVLLIPMIFVVRRLLATSPRLLERRMQMREREVTQRRLISFSALFFLAAFLLPGFDRRWGWSSVPLPVVLAADVVVLLSYGLTIRVLLENEFASRTVEVMQGQRVISTGPYAYVRHPMYLAVTLMVLASPIALGSWWALFPALSIIPILVVRILDEEKVLARDLEGYAEYRQKVRYRMVPGLW